MSMALHAAEAVQRLSRGDATLKSICLVHEEYVDEKLVQLVDCLLAHPDVAESVALVSNDLTDATGVKLARYLAASSTVRALNLAHNQFGEETHLALAAALHVNSSLRLLCLYSNQTEDRTRIDAAFIDALRLNPDRPAGSVWRLSSSSNEFEQWKAAADRLGHPSLQMLLVLRIRCTI